MIGNVVIPGAADNTNQLQSMFSYLFLVLNTII